MNDTVRAAPPQLDALHGSGTRHVVVVTVSRITRVGDDLLADVRDAHANSARARVLRTIGLPVRGALYVAWWEPPLGYVLVKAL